MSPLTLRQALLKMPLIYAAEVSRNSTQLPSGSSTMAMVTPGRIVTGAMATL